MEERSWFTGDVESTVSNEFVSVSTRLEKDRVGNDVKRSPAIDNDESNAPCERWCAALVRGSVTLEKQPAWMLWFLSRIFLSSLCIDRRVG